MILLICAMRADATTIIVYVDGDTVWIAADGLKTKSHAGRPVGWQEKVKVHPAFGGVVALYGYEADSEQRYLGTLSDLIREQIAKSASLAVFENNLPGLMADLLRKMQSPALEQIKKAAGDPSPVGYFGGKFPEIDYERQTGILFIGLDNHRLKAEVLKVGPTLMSTGRGNLELVYKNSGWEGLAQSPTPYLFPGRFHSLPNDASERVTKNPKEGILSLAQDMGVDDPCHVGAPYVVVKVTARSGQKKARTEWFPAFKGTSWEETDAKQPDGCTPANF